MGGEVVPLRLDQTGERIPPHNEQAEQSLLGAILVNNRAYERIGEFLKPEHFFHPEHAQIYQACVILIGRGDLASPITLKGHFEGTNQLNEVGGIEYLAQLASSIITVHAVKDYGKAILDCYVRRQMIEAAEQLVSDAYAQHLETPAEQILANGEASFYEIGSHLKSSSSRTVTAGQGAMGALQWIEQARKEGITGLSTGLRDLDYRFCGMRPGNLIIIGGRPGQGKSSLLRNIALHNGKLGIPVGILSLEMSAEEMGMGFLAQLTGISTDDQLSGRIDTGQFQALVEAQGYLDSLPIHIDDTAALTAPMIVQKARRLKRQYGIQMLGIDHLHFAKTTQSKDNKASQIGEITAASKALAKELEIPVVELAQLNRGVEGREDKRPGLADLRESGAIEQDADVVAFVFREEYYLEKNEPKQREGEVDQDYLNRQGEWERHKFRVRGLADIIVPKIRMGRAGTAQVRWSGIRQEFSDFQREGENHG